MDFIIIIVIIVIIIIIIINSASNWFLLHGSVELHCQQNIKKCTKTIEIVGSMELMLLIQLPQTPSYPV